MKCSTCGKSVEEEKAVKVDFECESRYLRRKFILCEKCACEILEKAFMNDPLCKRCDKEVKWIDKN